MILPSVAVTAIGPSGSPGLVLLSVAIAMGASVALATLGSACWTRHPGSRDVVFADLLLWGWLRKVRAERRLDKASALLGSEGLAGEGQPLSSARRCEILQQLAGMLEARDVYTHGHTRRVTRHAERIAREMGLPGEQVAKIRIAAALHDVGKVHTPREVLTKPGPLTQEEFEIIKRHPVDGAEMVAEVGDAEITAMVRHHHERLDGTGYPDGLAREEIPLGARIISVADTFDAMTSSRPYRGACKHKKALDVLSKEAGSQLDPLPVAAFQRYYSGRRSIAWSAFIVTAPQRLGSWAGGLFQGAGAGVAPLAQGLVAMGAAALAGGALGGQAASATTDSAKAHRAGAAVEVAAKQDRAGRDRRSRGSEHRSGSRRNANRRSRRSRPPGGHGDGRPGQPNTQGGGGEGASSADGPAGRPGPGGDAPTGGGPPTRPRDPVPPVRVPNVEVPKVDVPKVDVPPVKVPDVQVPDVQVPNVQVPNVNPPKVDVPKVPGVNPPRLP
jgi:putative nucleotidyltransferase with HDIG domain